MIKFVWGFIIDGTILYKMVALAGRRGKSGTRDRNGYGK